MRHIFITGGVVSSLGKGLTSASLGMLLESRGYSVRMQKLDPYLNIDPGTMSPYQHGEVYVLDDGAETDLDLGHYERFTNAPLSRNSSWTSGKIYRNVLRRERRGRFLGKTVQVIPHITDEIKRAIRSLRKHGVDFVLTEIGGTVGDIESLPFLESIRQFALDIGRMNCLFIHLTLIPYLKSSNELKTKPTQHSVSRLRQIGIQPDILICRTEKSISDVERNKIGLFCNLTTQDVIEEKDADFSIYEVPITLHNNGLDNRVLRYFGQDSFKLAAPDLSCWYDILDRLRSPSGEVTIAVVGKYAKHKDAYKSIYESIDHAGIKHRTKVRVRGLPSDSFKAEQLDDVNGILVPGGFGDRGVEGKIDAIKIARVRKIPFFGICLGMQCAVIEIARNICGMQNANSTEFDQSTPFPVITLLDEQRNITDKGGTMRLGSQVTILNESGRAFKSYARKEIAERHRHRYEFNNNYREKFQESGLLVSGTNSDGALVEVIELLDHPWFVGVQYHPEFKSKPTSPHPLFDNFIAAAINHVKDLKDIKDLKDSVSQ
ncbi:MAG: CTP synthase [Planctomycetaceae bacterium]|jgi:CTP synthase|nr:CTP synthase [Planctomycetaceae bacterium]